MPTEPIDVGNGENLLAIAAVTLLLTRSACACFRHPVSDALVRHIIDDIDDVIFDVAHCSQTQVAYSTRPGGGLFERPAIGPLDQQLRDRPND